MLAAERAHYELDAGNFSAAQDLLRTIEHSTNGSRLLPEQVWDTADIPERELFLGKPSGSACPLVWAHSEYVKLVRSLKDRKVFDQTPQTVRRYRIEKREPEYWAWRFNNKCRTMPAGKTLRLVTLAPAIVHWSGDGWQTVHDESTRDTGLGIHVVDLPTGRMVSGQAMVFTFFWIEPGSWENANFTVTIEDQ